MRKQNNSKFILYDEITIGLSITINKSGIAINLFLSIDIIKFVLLLSKEVTIKIFCHDDFIIFLNMILLKDSTNLKNIAIFMRVMI